MGAQSQQLSNLRDEVRQLKEQLAERNPARDQRFEERDQALVAIMRRRMEAQKPRPLWQRLFGTKSSQESP